MANSEAVATSELGHQPHEIYLDGRFYDVSKFKHPGGTIVKFFMGSGDATECFQQMHTRSKKAHKMLKGLPSRPAPDAEVARLAGNGKKEMGEDFANLHRDLMAEGYFDPNYPHIIYRYAEIFIMFGIGCYLLYRCEIPWLPCAFLRFLGLVMLGLVEGRCGWLMHEGGHGSLTGHIKLDRRLQQWTYGLGCGMSGGWWRSQHNRHHACPQKLQHDADLDTLPLVAFNAAVLKSTKNPYLQAWLRAQGYFFIPFTCLLVVLGWQLFLHPRHIQRKKEWMELLTFVVRYVGIFGYMLSDYSWSEAIFAYLVVQWVGGSYIFTNFSLSHTHLDVTQPDEHLNWVEYGACHTTNLSNHWFVNWWMAHLNFQIEHHLFPTMPQFRHPMVSKRVQVLFAKHGLKYDVRGYWSCLADTLRNLDDVGHTIADGDQKKDQ